jgi:hypothetical protein
MSQEAAKKAAQQEVLDDKLLLADFYRAQAETSSLPGVTIDIRDIAKKSVRAYWAAREGGAAYEERELDEGEATQAEVQRFDFVRQVWAAIDPAREFVRELLSAAVPTVAGVVFFGTGYFLITNGVELPFQQLSYLMRWAFAASAVTLIIYFWARREAFISSKWRLLQSSSGSLAGGLIAGTIAVSLCIYSFDQRTRVDRYETEVSKYKQDLNTVQGEAELARTVNEIQPAAELILASHNTDAGLDQVVKGYLDKLPLAKEANFNKVQSDRHKVIYDVSFKGQNTNSLDDVSIVFTPDKIGIKREDKYEYMILRGEIKEIDNNTIKLLLNNSTSDKQAFKTWTINNASLSRTPEDQQLKNLKGENVLVTYDFGSDNLTRVDLLNKSSFKANLFLMDSLPARIQNLNTTAIEKSGTAEMKLKFD